MRGGFEVPVIELRLAGVFLAKTGVVVAQSRISLGGLRLGIVLFGVLMLIVVAFLGRPILAVRLSRRDWRHIIFVLLDGLAACAAPIIASRVVLTDQTRQFSERIAHGVWRIRVDIVAAAIRPRKRNLSAIRRLWSGGYAILI